jgi:hypothetical protein
MAETLPEISGSNITLRGSFNPKIFQPEWFGRQNLLPLAEVEASEIKILHPQICQFETERFSIQVTQDQFAVSSKPATNAVMLRDLVLGTFFVLEHTPASAMGLNRQMHYSMGSEELWHQLGDRLVPKVVWKEVLSGRPGMLSLSIQTMKDDPPGAKLTIKVEPSQKLTHGVYFETNDHFPASEHEPLKFLMDILKKEWEPSQNHASKVASHIVAWAAR